MEMKSMINFEVEKNGNRYVFVVPMGAPFGESYDACFQILQKIIEMAQQTADTQKRQPVEEAK